MRSLYFLLSCTFLAVLVAAAKVAATCNGHPVSIAVDSLQNDFSGEIDRVRVTVRTGAGTGYAKVRIAARIGAMPTTSLADAVAEFNYAPNQTFVQDFELAGTEAYKFCAIGYYYQNDSGYTRADSVTSWQRFFLLHPQPAGLCQQLMMVINIQGGVICQTTTPEYLSYWVAERYWGGAGGSFKSVRQRDMMLGANPDFHPWAYQLYARYAHDTTVYKVDDKCLNADLTLVGDTVRLKAWCLANNHDVDTFVLRAATPITIQERMSADIGTGACVNDQWRSKSIPAGAIVSFPSYRDYEDRVMFDGRNTGWGNWLWYNIKTSVADGMTRGFFFDEEGAWKSNASGLAHLPMWPLNAATQWLSGNEFTSFTHPFASYFTSHNQAKDSASDWRRNYMGVVRDSAKKYGLVTMANFDGTAGTQAGWEHQWNNEIRHATVQVGGAYLGEYEYLYPSDIGYYVNCRNTVKHVKEVSDSACDLFVGWIRMGGYYPAMGISVSRSQMTGLGFMLECLQPDWDGNPANNSRVMFMPCQINGQVDWLRSGHASMPDSVALWTDCFAKFFGTPTTTWDTSQTGYDQYQQKYTIDKKALLKPGTTDTLTLVVGRLGRNDQPIFYSTYNADNSAASTTNDALISLGNTAPTFKITVPVWSTNQRDNNGTASLQIRVCDGATWNSAAILCDTAFTLTIPAHATNTGASPTVSRTFNLGPYASSPHTIKVDFYGWTGANAGQTACRPTIVAVADSIYTAMATTVPGDASVEYRELKNSATGTASWGPPVLGGSTIYLANAQFRIFSRDTAMSNIGVASVPQQPQTPSTKKPLKGLYAQELPTPDIWAEFTLSHRLVHYARSDIY